MKRILFIVLLYPLSLLAGPGQIGGGGSSSGGPTNGLTAAQVTAAMQAYNTTSTIPIPNSTLSVSAATATGANYATNWVGFAGRTFFVATNGNNATAVIGDSTHPFAPIFNWTNGVCHMATNAGDTIY